MITPTVTTTGTTQTSRPSGSSALLCCDIGLLIGPLSSVAAAAAGGPCGAAPVSRPAGGAIRFGAYGVRGGDSGDGEADVPCSPGAALRPAGARAGDRTRRAVRGDAADRRPAPGDQRGHHERRPPRRRG